MMRFCLLAGLVGLAAGIQARVAPEADDAAMLAPDAVAAAQSAPAAQVDLSSAPAAGADVQATAAAAAQTAAVQGIFNRIGDFMKQNANRSKKVEVKRNVAQEKIQKRAELAPSRVGALRAILPQLRQAATTMCGAAAVAGLCDVRMKMFDTLASRIEGGDVEVVDLLRKSTGLLHDFMQMDDNVRGAISSLTLHELEGRPPAGMKPIADINPKDGNVDRYEWSEYMKATYLFTLTDEAASALEMKHGKSSNRMKKFISWDTRDVPAPKPAPALAAPASDAAPVQAEVPAPTEGIAMPPQMPVPEEAPQAPVVEEPAAPEAATPPQEAQEVPAPEEAATPPQEAQEAPFVE